MLQAANVLASRFALMNGGLTIWASTLAKPLITQPVANMMT
jgi:hypothetical protein